MLRLETVEDFEKAKKAFDDPKSSPDDYRVKDFGFCCFCDRITQHLIEAMNKNGHVIFCCSCKRNYRPASWMEYVPAQRAYCTYYITVLPVNSDTGGRIDWLHSCSQQRDFFRDALEAFIKKQKAEERKTRNIIRRLAKLRSARKSSSTRWALDHLS